jgi:hypothetical protein
VGRGLALRGRLIPILGTFKAILMWTFTIDPKLFASPAAAYEHVKKKRCISNVMRRLRERGHLHTDRYICIVEWQKETEMPHFHVLADASFVPFDLVCELWNRFRPGSAGPVDGVRPGFGSVRFSAPRFKSPEHAARYACKYLIKHPVHGYPAWVLDTCGEVHRYSTSRGFWGACEEEEEHECSADSAVDGRYQRRRIRDRLAECGRCCVVLKLVEGTDERTGEVVVRRSFVGLIGIGLTEACSFLERILADEQRRIGIEREEVSRLLRRFGGDQKLIRSAPI